MKPSLRYALTFVAAVYAAIIFAVLVSPPDSRAFATLPIAGAALVFAVAWVIALGFSALARRHRERRRRRWFDHAFDSSVLTLLDSVDTRVLVESLRDIPPPQQRAAVERFLLLTYPELPTSAINAAVSTIPSLGVGRPRQVRLSLAVPHPAGRSLVRWSAHRPYASLERLRTGLLIAACGVPVLVIAAYWALGSVAGMSPLYPLGLIAIPLSLGLWVPYLTVRLETIRIWFDRLYDGSAARFADQLPDDVTRAILATSENEILPAIRILHRAFPKILASDAAEVIQIVRDRHDSSSRRERAPDASAG